MHVLLLYAGLVGSSNSSSVTFPAGTSASSPIPISPFSIENDMIGLEEDEMYQLMFIDVLNDTSNVILGQPTSVIIFDEDGELKNFSECYCMLFAEEDEVYNFG